MNIDEMQAGREMDALVAERVMGWDRDVMGCLGAPKGAKEYDTQCHSWIGAWDENGNPNFLPHYSTDIAAAWQVVEWMKDWNFTLDWLGSDWQAMFQTEDDGEFFVNADTALLAICRAALKALEVDA